MKMKLNSIPWREIALASLATQTVTTVAAMAKLYRSNVVATQNAHLVAEVLTVTQQCAEACSDIADDTELAPEEAVRQIGQQFNFMMQVVGERLETSKNLNGDANVSV